MTGNSEIGATIMPTVTSFYFRPKTIADMVGHTVGRALDLFDMDFGLAQRWKDAAE